MNSAPFQLPAEISPNFKKERKKVKLTNKICNEEKESQPTFSYVKRGETDRKNNKDKFPPCKGFPGMNSQLILKGFSSLKLAQVG